MYLFSARFGGFLGLDVSVDAVRNSEVLHVSVRLLVDLTGLHGRRIE